MSNPTDTLPEAPMVPDSERKGGCSAVAGSPLVALYEWAADQCHQALQEKERWQAAGDKNMVIRCEGKSAAFHETKRKLLAEIRAENAEVSRGDSATDARPRK